MKTCCICREEKTLDEFGACSTTKDGKQSKCVPCNRYQAKLHYDANKKKHFARARARQLRIGDALNLVKETAGCQICGEKCGLCLDFHHIAGDKNFSVSCVWMGIARLLAEIQKCEVVCANCHRKIHGGLVSLGPRRNLDASALEKLIDSGRRLRRRIGTAPDS